VGFALTLEDVSKLYYFQPNRKEEQWAKDFRFFSYLGNGTTYVVRHTFSTVLKRSGVSTEFIQESLGH